MIDAQATTKACGRCKTDKPLAEFGKNRASKDGLQWSCRACHSASVVASQRRHPERVRRTRREYEARHPARVKAYRQRVFAAYYDDNRERLCAAARARNHERIDQIRDRDRTEEGRAVRRAAKRLRAQRLLNGDLPPRMPKALIADIRGRFGNACVYCGATSDLETDHFIALDNGGRHIRGNIVVACSGCNDRKATFDPFDWMATNGIDADRVVAAMCEARA